MPRLKKMEDVIIWCVLLVKRSFAGLVLDPGNHTAPVGITAIGSMKLIHSLLGVHKLSVNICHADTYLINLFLHTCRYQGLLLKDTCFTATDT